MDKIDPGRPEYIYMQAAAVLEARIRGGKLPAGSRLPGELHLADDLGVAYGSVRKALEVLRERGLVVTVPSRGTFVVDPLPPA